MTGRLVVMVGDDTLIDLAVPRVHARRVALLAHVGPEHVAGNPRNAAAVAATFADEVGAAIAAAGGPLPLWTSARSDPAVHVDIFLATADSGASAGGTGAWPAGGGGGGGGALGHGAGPGGDGADGAVAVFQWSEDGRRFNVHLAVSPGEGTVVLDVECDYVQVFAFGGGGGGGGGALLASAM